MALRRTPKQDRVDAERALRDLHSELIEASRQDEIAYRRYLEAHDHVRLADRYDWLGRLLRYLTLALGSAVVLARDAIEELGPFGAVATGAALAGLGGLLGYYDGLSGRGIFTISAHGAQVKRLQAEVDVYFASLGDNFEEADAVPWPRTVDWP